MLLITLAIVAFSTLIQATAGFGAALLGLPLLLWAGHTLVEAQLILIGAMLPQNIFSHWKLRQHLEPNELWVPVTIRILAMPLGVAGLVGLMAFPQKTISQVVGLVIIGVVAAQCLSGFEWKNARRWYWVLATFSLSGFLQGFTLSGAAPIVLWLHGQRYSIDRARAYLFAIYLICFAPQMILLYREFGNTVWQPFFLGVITFPIVLIASQVGLTLGRWIGDQKMRTLTYTMLVIFGLAAIVEPFVRN